MGRILRWGSLQLCQSLVNGLYFISLKDFKKQFYKEFQTPRLIENNNKKIEQ